MKTSFALLAAGASIAAAQIPSGLPGCGNTCLTNMVNIASSEFGCTSGDIACYCADPRFGYGIRDCAHEACGDSSVANSVISSATSYCQNAVASAGSSGVAATTAGALSVLSSALGDATTTGAASGAQSTAITTSALVGTITSDGSTFVTTTGLSTIYGDASSVASSLASEASSAASSASGAVSSALSSASSAASSAAASASSKLSSLASAASSAASTATGGSSSTGGGASSTGGVGPMRTAAPMAGAIGIAAMLLI